MPLSRPVLRGRLLILLLASLMAGGGLLAQRGFFGGGQVYVPPGTKTAREIESRSTGTPMWENPGAFRRDVFTFARLQYDTYTDVAYRGRGGWTTDLPDADLNLSYRLQQMTALKVDPDARLIRITDPDIASYPFLFAVSPGSIGFNEQEMGALRNYLRNGGFLLMTDFWGDVAWNHVERIFKEVLPESNFEELPIEHPLYRSVFTILEKAQVPNIRMGLKVSPSTIHHRVIRDAKGRFMVMGLHNSDDSDGWEREGEDKEYFEKYAEKIAYPLAINIIFYIMTH